MGDGEAVEDMLEKVKVMGEWYTKTGMKPVGGKGHL